MEDFKPGFYQIPHIVAEECEPHESFVYAIIYWFYTMKEGRCYASNDRLAKCLPYKSSSSSVANAIHSLTEKGFLHCVYLDENKRNRKEIIPLVRLAKLDTPTGETSIHPQVNRDTPTGEQIRISKQDKLISEASASRKDIDSIEDDISFETDEELVPTKTLRKQNKPKSIEPDIQKMWSFWPGEHGHWKIEKTMRASSEVLLREHGLEKVQWAVEFWLDNKNDPFCPDISTPYKLAAKYDSLRQYRSKKYGY